MSLVLSFLEFVASDIEMNPQLFCILALFNPKTLAVLQTHDSVAHLRTELYTLPNDNLSGTSLFGSDRVIVLIVQHTKRSIRSQLQVRLFSFRSRSSGISVAHTRSQQSMWYISFVKRDVNLKLNI